MISCAACGGEVPDQFRFCGWCGEPLMAGEPAAGPLHETRRSVTIVFSDLKGSTALGERLDSEALREVMTRYFEEMSGALERHGGTVEKFIGDAIMAVFGFPVAHEDDALRAVRAALEMKERLAVLNVELEKRWGVTLANRTGVNTGPVIASGDPTTRQRLVTGDTVNVAARLEQAAPEYEVLIGESTYRLVREAVEVEEVEPLELKGKSERVPAYRVLAVERVGGAARRHDLPLVGREQELEALTGALDAAVDERSAKLVVVHADAGAGKSRLIEELTGLVGDRGGLAFSGRCLPYGRGITFWPLVEIVAQAAGIVDEDGNDVARAKIAELVDDAGAAERVQVAVGLSEERFPMDELFWGARKLFEGLGRDRPVVAVFEDVHWAETALLDLVAHLTTVASDAQLLLVCTARPELDARHPDWPQIEGALEVDLGPLPADAVDRLVEQLLGGAVPAGARREIVRAAEGNPLFVEQLVTMFVDEGALRREDNRWIAVADFSAGVAIPTSIDTLLAARLDLLPEDELVVTESASVIGQVFVTEPVGVLVPDAAGDVDARLERIQERRLVLRGDEADTFRFQHILIRDSAYNRLPKRSRARLHALFAGWAERVNKERGRELEFQEIVGYHLEQARGYLLDLAPLDEEGVELGYRAAGHLGPAGLRAFGRGDMWAASSLLRRTVDLLPGDSRERVELLPNLGEALMEIGEFANAQVCLDNAVAAATDLGDQALQADAELTRLLVAHHTVDDLEGWRAEVQTEADRVIPLLEGNGNDAVLAKAWRMVAFVHGTVCRWQETADALERAIRSAREAQDDRQVARLSASYVMALSEGPTPAPEAIRRAEEVLHLGVSDRQAQALALLQLAPLHAMSRDFDRARELVGQAVELLRELGITTLGARTSDSSARVELMAGDLEAAESQLRADYDALTAMDERYYRPNITALLAKTVYELGRRDEAEELAAVAAELASPEDVEALALLRSVQARLLASRGEADEARAVALNVVELIGKTDAPVFRADVLVDLADALVASPEGAAALAEARSLYLQKQHLVGVARVESFAAAVYPT
jgi:class 3 adenylate cyclase/tetratricopeptide (TPR) repeat protein